MKPIRQMSEEVRAAIAMLNQVVLAEGPKLSETEGLRLLAAIDRLNTLENDLNEWWGVLARVYTGPHPPA